MTWPQFYTTLRYFVTSILSLGAFVSAWIYLGLPQVASKDYVDGKFQTASDSSKIVQVQVNSVRIQLNKMNRQALEAEKYRLTNEAKTNNSFDLQRRIQDIDVELADIQRERERLFSPN